MYENVPFSSSRVPLWPLPSSNHARVSCKGGGHRGNRRFPYSNCIFFYGGNGATYRIVVYGCVRLGCVRVRFLYNGIKGWSAIVARHLRWRSFPARSFGGTLVLGSHMIIYYGSIPSIWVNSRWTIYNNCRYKVREPAVPLWPLPTGKTLYNNCIVYISVGNIKVFIWSVETQ
jgi:hypothetical protein